MASCPSILHLSALSSFALRASFEINSLFFSLGTNRWLMNRLSSSLRRPSSISWKTAFSAVVTEAMDGSEEIVWYEENRQVSLLDYVGKTLADEK